MRQGPVLETLLRHLAECPPDFLAEPVRPGGGGQVDVAAVISDLLVSLGGRALDSSSSRPFRYPDAGSVGDHRRRLGLLLVAAWLFHHPWFREAAVSSGVSDWLSSRLDELASLVEASEFVTDPERREELARLCLFELGYVPAGETAEQARDRLFSVSSTERARVARESAAAEERARELREALARKRQEEAASIWARE